MDKQLGKTIRILRQAKSLKVTEVAKKSGVSVPYLSLVENGERQPSLEVMRRIAGTLGVPSEALIVMGMGGAALKSNDERTAALTDTVGRLIEMESKLSKLLGKESRSGAKTDMPRTSRRRNGTERR